MINKKWKANRPRVIGSTDIKPYWRVIENIVNDSDIVLEVLDARMPYLSRNEELEELVLRKGKKLIFVLNKADLVSKKTLQINFKKLKKEGEVFVVSSSEKIGTKRLRDYLFAFGKKFDKLNIGVLGYPNTGKSSVINSIVLKNKAKVTSKAGTTHGQQWISLKENIRIIDSPGVIPIKENDEVRLALIGSKNIEKIKDLDIIAEIIIDLFVDREPIKKLYGVNCNSEDALEIVREIGEKKGFLKKGGDIDERRVDIMIIRDWQSGRLRQ